jgi:hypothetical protein
MLVALVDGVKTNFGVVTINLVNRMRETSLYGLKGGAAKPFSAPIYAL